MSVKSVAVTGYYGRDNVGDEILLSSLIDLITERYGDVEVFVLTSDVKRTEELHDVTAVTESNPIEWVKTSMRVDALIIGGGGLFANSIHLRYPILILINTVLNNQIWVVGISVAPIENRYDEALLRFALTSVDSIVVRDEASKVRLRDIGISRRIDVLPDLAFAGDGTSKTAVPREIPKDFIVVSVRPPTGYSRSELNTRELARSLDSLKVDLESEIVFLPFKPDVDIKVSRQVTSEMEYSAEIFEDPDDFREVEGILSEADFLVGMRLHSVILSARNHVPFVGLSYHPKCESVLQQLGTEEVMWCDSFDANKLTARVKKRYNSDDISETLEAEHQGLAAAAEKNIIQASVADEVPSYTDKFIYLAVSLVLIPLSIVHHRWEIYRGG
jgi:polysaccharide pyruvyl transferase CsaB